MGARKVEQICNSIFCRDIWNGNTQPPPKAIFVSVQAKFVNVQPAKPCSIWSCIDFETSMYHRCGTQLGITDTYGYVQDERGSRGTAKLKE